MSEKLCVVDAFKKPSIDFHLLIPSGASIQELQHFFQPATPVQYNQESLNEPLLHDSSVVQTSLPGASYRAIEQGAVLATERVNWNSSWPIQFEEGNDNITEPLGVESIDRSPELGSDSDGKDAHNGYGFLEEPKSVNLICIRRNKPWVDLFYKHALSHSVMDDKLTVIGAPMKKWNTVVDVMGRKVGLMSSVEQYDPCPGHCCFASLKEVEILLRFTVCGKRNPATGEERLGSFKYVPLNPRIRSIVANKRQCLQLQNYLARRENAPCLFREYFDGSLYQDLFTRLFREQDISLDVFIMVSTDGFQVFKNRRGDVLPFLAVLPNLGFSSRYRVSTVHPLSIDTDEMQPKELQSYFIPLVNGVLRGQTDGGMRMRFLD
ncbi:unnamed protein product [Agarophyton chilense]